MDAEFTRIGPKCLNNKYNKSDLCNEEISFTNCYEKHYDSAAEYLHRQLTFLLSSWEENGYTNWPFLNYDGTEDLKGFLSEFSPSQLKIFWLKSKQNDVQAQDTKKQMHYEI